MDEQEFLAEQFEEHRARLRAVAFRMLGSRSEADDAVQEAWIRLSRSGVSGVEDLGAWLTTIVARVSLNMLQSRASRREDVLGEEGTGSPRAGAAAGAAATGELADPEQEALLADSVGVALLVVLDQLSPAERLAFVLHDLFGVPFDEIAPIIDRSPPAARQLASRARRRVHGASPEGRDWARQGEIVSAFLAASRGGDFDALLALLDPDVVLRGDRAVVRMGGSEEVRGPAAVAGIFQGRAQGAQPALVDGVSGAVWLTHGKPRVVFSFSFSDGRITSIELVGDRERLSRLEVAVLSD
jgi:RNA polymerase sigma factor (sigma-70 family)